MLSYGEQSEEVYAAFGSKLVRTETVLHHRAGYTVGDRREMWLVLTME
jgi:hypothetical protein